MKVVHLPFYTSNSYQTLLTTHLEELGVKTIRGGGGGTFLRTALRVWKPNILHFHWIHPYMVRPTARATIIQSLFLLAQLRILRARGVRIVWTAHNLHSHESKFPKLEHRLMKGFLACNDAVIAHCECAKKDIMKIFGVPDAKVFVVPHGNYVGTYPDTATRAESRKELKLSEDATVLLFLGQIRPYKGVLDLLKAFAQLQRATEAPLHLVIAGKPINEEAVKEIEDAIRELDGGRGDLEATVHFHPGYVDNERIQFYMHASDAVVFPYRDILTSGAVLLAMSFGRACIAPRLGCIGETLDDAGGFLYDPSQDGALEDALRASVSRKDELEKMGEHNGQRVQEWNWDHVASLTRNVYSQITKSKS